MGVYAAPLLPAAHARRSAESSPASFGICIFPGDSAGRRPRVPMILPRAGLRASHGSEKACVLHEHRLFDFMLVWSCRIFCPRSGRGSFGCAGCPPAVFLPPVGGSSASRPGRPPRHFIRITAGFLWNTAKLFIRLHPILDKKYPNWYSPINNTTHKGERGIGHYQGDRLRPAHPAGTVGWKTAYRGTDRAG